ncbi:MAG: hypothetical protein V1708_06045 [Candidatus Micrarchaeota archaeon]
MKETTEEQNPRVLIERMTTEVKRLGFKHRVFNNGLKLVIPLEGNERNQQILSEFAKSQETSGEPCQKLIEHLLRTAKLEGCITKRAHGGGISKGRLNGAYSIVPSEKKEGIKGITIHFTQNSASSNSQPKKPGPKTLPATSADIGGDSVDRLE